MCEYAQNVASSEVGHYRVASKKRASAEEWVESISLKDALKKLNERELGIITRRFYKGKTQMEIAAEIGISQAQVSRLEKGAIDKLRRYMS